MLPDLRFAVRSTRRTPGLALVAILSIAIGIGATSAVFSVIHAVLIDP
jgi:putative ABC transport system permease protein